MDHVRAILESSIIVVCSSPPVIQELESNRAVASNGNYELQYSSKQELAHALQLLQRLGLLFADEPAGWPPAAVFQHYRDEGLVVGSIKTVSWRRLGEPVYGKA